MNTPNLSGSRFHAVAALAAALLLTFSTGSRSATCRDPERFTATVTVRQLPVDLDTDVPRMVLEAVTAREGAEVGHRVQFGHSLLEGARSKGPCGARQKFQVDLVAVQAQVLVARELQPNACRQSVALNMGMAHMGDVQGLLDRAGYALRSKLERELQDFSTAWGGDEQSPVLLAALMASQAQQVLRPLEDERVQAWAKRIDAPTYRLERARCALQTREQPLRPAVVSDANSAGANTSDTPADAPTASRTAPAVRYRISTRAD